MQARNTRYEGYRVLVPGMTLEHTGGIFLDQQLRKLIWVPYDDSQQVALEEAFAAGSLTATVEVLVSPGLSVI